MAAVVLMGGVVYATSFPGVPPVSVRVLDRDWCTPSSYRQAREAAARAHVKLSEFAKRNLSESEQTARAHPAGCRLAMAATPRRAALLPSNAQWVKPGSRGEQCPRNPLPFTANWHRRAARAALAYENRSERPIFIDAARASAAGNARGSEIVRACGKAAARRTAVVDLSLTAFYPSASLSGRTWAVARFSGWGWRPFLLLH